MSPSQYLVFQPEGNEQRENFWHNMLFCLIPNFQVGKNNYLKKGIGKRI